MKYKGIVFDFNGVILWDDEWHEEAWNMTSRKLRGKPLESAEWNAMHGGNNKRAFEIVLGREIDGKELSEFIQLKEQMYRDIAIGKPDFKLSPGAEKLFDLLVEKNIPHAIATSSEITNLNFYLEKLDLEKWFVRDNIIYDDGHLPSKPAPDIYLRAMEKINLQPPECIVVEDASAGIEAAHRAGAGKVIHLTHGAGKTWLGKGPDKIIQTLGEITLVDFEMQ